MVYDVLYSADLSADFIGGAASVSIEEANPKEVGGSSGVEARRGLEDNQQRDIVGRGGGAPLSQWEVLALKGQVSALKRR